MKIKVKKVINGKFGVSLFPGVEYNATKREDGNYSVQVNSIVSILVLKKNVEVIE